MAAASLKRAAMQLSITCSKTKTEQQRAGRECKRATACGDAPVISRIEKIFKSRDRTFCQEAGIVLRKAVYEPQVPALRSRMGCAEPACGARVPEVRLQGTARRTAAVIYALLLQAIRATSAQQVDDHDMFFTFRQYVSLSDFILAAYIAIAPTMMYGAFISRWRLSWSESASS